MDTNRTEMDRSLEGSSELEEKSKKPEKMAKQVSDKSFQSELNET